MFHTPIHTLTDAEIAADIATLRNGGFRTLAEAIDAVEKTVKYGTTNV
jgi:hypothetical protein